MNSLIPENDEVFYVDGDLVKIGRDSVDFLKKKAKENDSKKSRVCTHKDVDDPVHEMIIVHEKEKYVRPHKHSEQESFFILEGTAEAIFFDEDGNVIKIISMGNYSSGKEFYYRIRKSCYHTLLITSDILVFYEVKQGPLKRENTTFAPWSPEESDEEGVAAFIKKLSDL